MITLRKPKKAKSPKGTPSAGHGVGNDIKGVNGTKYLTIKDVAGLLRVCTKTVRRLIKQKDVPTVRVGRQIRIPAEHLPLLVTKEW